MKFLDSVKAVAGVLVDSYFVVDARKAIVDYNRAFHSMLPRSVARGLKGKKCHEVLQLSICQENCIAEQCWKAKKGVRLDEIQGHVAKTEKQLTFILSSLPFFDDRGQVQGALVVHRNVTDEAQIQQKYQELLENADRERETLDQTLRERTEALINANKQLLNAQRQLLELRRSYFGA